MDNLQEWMERGIYAETNETIIKKLQELNLIKKSERCKSCEFPLAINKYKKVIIGYAWRCSNRKCSMFKKCTSLLTSSFFESFNLNIKVVLAIIAKYAIKTPRMSIIDSFKISHTSVEKVIKVLIAKMERTDFSMNKLGGPGKIVQADETMLNYKCKSHRGRSAENKTDALCIVEVGDHVERAYVTCIEDATGATILPIICDQVHVGSTIYTDDAKVYKKLTKLGFIHRSVIHKYNFVDPVSGVHTQAVESFNNYLKHAIKTRKGVRTVDRPDFCKEMCFFFNNKKNVLQALLSLIKVY